jgi:hypothetical protein
MNARLHRPGLLTADGIRPLLDKKKQLQREAIGKLPEPLVQATVQIAQRLVLKEPARQVLRPRVFALARQVLHELAGKRTKPTDTLVLLLRRSLKQREGGEHGTAG